MDEGETVEAFLSDIPKLHSWDGGTTWNTGGFTRRELAAIIDVVARDIGPGAVVAETGAGNSTVAMVLAHASRVISVAPDKPLFERIVAACRMFGSEPTALEAHVAVSEDVLPQIAQSLEAAGRQLDFALIDGGHGWPTAFVDFCYLNRLLRKDGFLMIDDFQVYAIKEMARFLMEDPNFSLINRFRKTLLFRKKTTIRYLPDFGGQPYIRRRSREDREAGKAFEI